MNDPAHPSSSPYDLSAIDARTLTPVIRTLLKSDVVELLDWRHSGIHGGFGDADGAVISALFRFEGQARDGDAVRDWSLLLKIVGTAEGGADPSDTRYWKREVLAYQSGALADLSGGLAAPRFYGVIEFAEEMVGFWLEDLTDDIGPLWPLERYGLAARHLGQFNGSYLTGKAMPTGPWVSRDWIRHHVSPNEALFAELERSQHEPEARRWFLDDDAGRILRLWEERASFLAALNRLPQTFVHRDAFRRNLFARQSEEGELSTVAVDWAFPGIGAVGEDLTSLFCATLAYAEVDMADARELDKLVFEGYLAGLGDAGWTGDPRLARLGFTAASAMIFGLGYSAFMIPESFFPALEDTFGMPMAALISLWAMWRRTTLDLADEARQLMAELGLA
jgi:hypothetical protein